MITIAFPKTEHSRMLQRALKAMMNTDLIGVDEILAYEDEEFPLPSKLSNVVRYISKPFELECTSDYLVIVDPSSVITDKDWISRLSHDLSDKEYRCSAGRVRDIGITTSYGSALSVDPLHYLDLAPILNRPSDNICSVPTGPAKIINTDWYRYLEAHVFDAEPLFIEHARGLAAWQFGGLCTVVPDLSILYDTHYQNPHPYEYYSSKFSLMRRMGISEAFIKSCVSESPIIQQAYQLSLEPTDPNVLFSLTQGKFERLHSKIIESNKVSFGKFKWNVPAPKMKQRIGTFGKAIEQATQRFLTDPTKVIAASNTRRKRLDICLSCMARKDTVCLECGCFVAGKVSVATEECPLSPPLWPSV